MPSIRNRKFQKSGQRSEKEFVALPSDLLMADKYPSRRRVLAPMGDSELRGEHSILREVRRAILAFRSSSVATNGVGPFEMPPAFPA
jgi:hypothetical protein